MSDPAVFWCPSDEEAKPTDITNDKIDAKNSAQVSYLYNPGLAESDESDFPTPKPCLAEPKLPSHTTVSCAFWAKLK